ncbi:hypothetical protein LENED_004529 [Lentinula edodes]|uniref:Uncharacterized protein n=1 Tax=Lentinula edodes TaxID=5353 RepID=A0A1Q3E6G8_LENED|nr:hypothetical protein LENED_004529 [Lentinula edodes]
MLDRVELKRLTWTHNGRGVSNLGRVSSHVEWHILELRHGKNLRDLAEWLGAHNPTPIIRSFYYDATSQSEVYHLRNLLRRIAPSLRYLQVSFPVFADNRSKSDALRDFIDLQECTSLRSLRYKHILLMPDDAVTTMISPWVSQMLSQIPSDSLEDVGFELMLPNSGDETCLKQLDWSGISSALSRKEFRYLRSIQFSMSAGTGFNSACATNYILDRMPSFKHALRRANKNTKRAACPWLSLGHRTLVGNEQPRLIDAARQLNSIDYLHIHKNLAGTLMSLNATELAELGTILLFHTSHIIGILPEMVIYGEIRFNPICYVRITDLVTV